MNINTVVARQRRELEHTLKFMRNEILSLEKQLVNDLKLTNEQINLLTALLTLLNSKGE